MKNYFYLKVLYTSLFLSSLFGQFNSNYYGFGLDIGTSGTGFFLTLQSVDNSEIFSLNGEIRFYDIKAKNEFVRYNYYYQQYESIGGISLFMVPIFIGGNYYPFNGQIENNFAPFITMRAGVNITFDGKEVGTFTERWNNVKTIISPGGFLGVGIDFMTSGSTSISTIVGEEILPLSEVADDYDDYSGLLIHISFNRRFKN